MRSFSSYGPPNINEHYYAPRKDLVEKAYRLLIGEEKEKSGHYITVWAPRQCGKTWTLLQVYSRLKDENWCDSIKINLEHLKTETDIIAIISNISAEILREIGKPSRTIDSLSDFQEIFSRDVLDKQLILILDEFDALATKAIEAIAGVFRNIYIHRQQEINLPVRKRRYLLKSIALIGVRSVLGIENDVGSPFNVQRNLYIPELSYQEVIDLFKWYEKESNQPVAPEVVEKLYETTMGQPGLICWFAELLTETYNNNKNRAITAANFKEVYAAAVHLLPSPNIANLIAKAKQEPYKRRILELFQTDTPLKFSFDDNDTNFLYMHGIIKPEPVGDLFYMRFSSPFVQTRLFNYFARDLFPDMGQLVEPFEKLQNAISKTSLNIKRILALYQKYLDINSGWLFKDAPRRKDLRIIEAVFHFNLYSYLDKLFAGKKISVWPEFPTGNGNVDIIIFYNDIIYGMELKTFGSESGYKDALEQTARYAQKLKLKEIFLVFFISSIDETNRKRYETPFIDKEKSIKVTPVFIKTGENNGKMSGVLPHLAISRKDNGKSTLFVGREKELAVLEKSLAKKDGKVQTITGRLFDFTGAGGIGKTMLALAAAQRFAHIFPDGVMPPVRVDEHTPASFAVLLARHFGFAGVPEPADEREAQAMITHILKQKRTLIILDNVVDWQSLRFMLPIESAAAIIVTTRDRDLHKHIRLEFPGLEVESLSLEKFTEQEALALFRGMLADEYRQAEDALYLEIAASLGYLPIALRQAISLMLFGPHYNAAELRDKLAKEDRLEILRRGAAVEGSDCRVIETFFDLSSSLLTAELLDALQYLAVCAFGPAPLDFLQRLAGRPDIDRRMEQLYAYSWCERRDGASGREYELHRLVRELVNLRFNDPHRREFIDLVHEIITSKDEHFSKKDELFPQLQEAFSLATEQKDVRLKTWLLPLYYFCVYRGYGGFYIRLTEAVERLFPDDRWALRVVYAHRALILQDWGKLAEAMALLKKQEQICEELGDRAGLAACWGNQALILNALGKLDEAMSLLKKQEQICEELGDRTGLAACWGNQALILNALGKLDEAMALLKKQEQICEELGDRAGLARTYGNQALILQDWGKLAEALALHKKEEQIKEELGDRAGLAICWWNQGIIYGKQGDRAKQIELWQKSIAANKAMGIPTEKDEEEVEKVKKKKVDW